MNVQNDSQILLDVKPTSHRKVIDLVKEAGIDVSDWKNFRGGIEKASTNPKYCYEWSFTDGDTIVLNLWFSNCSLDEGLVIQKMNMRKEANDFTGARKHRALNMDSLLLKAAVSKCPIRVIMCDKTISTKNLDAKPKVNNRMLDPINWYIKEYVNGDCILQRGEAYSHYVDQFSLRDNESSLLGKRDVSSTVYLRSQTVRAQVLERAKGICEYCCEKGFITNTGALYLESHHVIPLCEGGEDSLNNVIALCPNHHREAHYGENYIELRKTFFSKNW
tara:strand:+ start:21838 stop:22665 length:828 start_codon:yes stop_codon:yes gene_type:complete